MKRKYVSLALEICFISQNDIVCTSPVEDVSDPYDRKLFDVEQWFKF